MSTAPDKVIQEIAARQQELQSFLKGRRLPSSARTEAYAWVVSKDRLGLANLSGAVAGEADDATKSIPFVISTVNEDRDGDVLVPGGAVLQNYARNPVIFFGHQKPPWEVPIGKAMGPDGKLAVQIHKDHISSTCFFDGDDPDSDYIYGKVKRGFLNAASVSYVPIEAERRRRNKAQGRDVGESPPGWYFIRYDVTEWSIVGVPANAGAIRDSLDSEKSYISPRLYKAMSPYAAVPKGRCFAGWCPVEKSMKTVSKSLSLDEAKRHAEAAKRDLQAKGVIVRGPNVDNFAETIDVSFGRLDPDATVARKMATDIARAHKASSNSDVWINWDFVSGKSVGDRVITTAIGNRKPKSNKIKNKLPGAKPMSNKTKKTCCPGCKEGKKCQGCQKSYTLKNGRLVEVKKKKTKAAVQADTASSGTNFPDKDVDCVGMKTTKLMEEGGYDEDQAGAIAFKMCEEGKDGDDITGHEDVAKALGMTSGAEGGYLVEDGKKLGTKLVPLSQVPGYWRVGDRFGRELKNSPLFRSKEEALKWIAENQELAKSEEDDKVTKAEDKDDDVDKDVVPDEEDQLPGEKIKDDEEAVTEDEELVEEGADVHLSEEDVPADEFTEEVEEEKDEPSDDPEQNIESMEHHMEEAEQQAASGDTAGLAATFAHIMEHLQTGIDWLDQQFGAIEQSSRKAMQGIVPEDKMEDYLDTFKEMTAAVAEPLRQHTLALAKMAEERFPGVDLKSLIEEKMDDAEEITDEFMEGDADDETDLTTEEAVQEYQQIKRRKSADNDLPEKQLSKAHRSKACSCMKEASDFLRDSASDEGIPKRVKGGMLYHSYNLAKTHKDIMEDGDDDTPIVDKDVVDDEESKVSYGSSVTVSQEGGKWCVNDDRTGGKLWCDFRSERDARQWAEGQGYKVKNVRRQSSKAQEDHFKERFQVLVNGNLYMASDNRDTAIRMAERAAKTGKKVTITDSESGGRVIWTSGNKSSKALNNEPSPEFAAQVNRLEKLFMQVTGRRVQ